MRKLVASAVVSAFLAACGSSSSGSAAPPQSPLTGRVGGRAFTPVAVQAISVGTGSSPCTLPGVGSLGVRAVELAVTSYAGACSDLAAAQCTLHRDAQAVTIIVAKVNPIPPNSEPALTPGTYTVQAHITDVVPSGTTLDVAYAEAVAPDPSCLGTAHPSVQGGTIRIDQASGPITGHLSLTFDDGSSLSGDFSAPLCPGVTPDVCTRALGGALCSLPAACVGP